MTWISVKDRLPDTRNVLAICKTEKGQNLMLVARGWFHDITYSCRFDSGRFIIQSHGPEIPATHWMPLPEPPKDKE